MLIRIGGGTAGIKEYLLMGRKQGRSESRHELDERIVLAGDLELTDQIIANMQREGEKYLHITLSFKEDRLETSVLQSIVAEFRDFMFSAYRTDEYQFYAEAHLPRIKTSVDHRTGETIERKPHIHIVVPKINLLSNTHLNPFGLVEHNKTYIDAFQESVNARYGLASPKDNRRLEAVMVGKAGSLSRYKGDIFRAQNAEIKERLLDEILHRQIQNMPDFYELIEEYGELRIRNEGQHGEYCNVKPEGAEKGINLKEFVFSRGFIELPIEEKIERIRDSHVDSGDYVSAAIKQPPDPAQVVTLERWRESRALEIKYLNSGRKKEYQNYQASSPSEQAGMLKGLQERFYELYVAPILHRDPEIQQEDGTELTRPSEDFTPQTTVDTTETRSDTGIQRVTGQLLDDYEENQTAFRAQNDKGLQIILRDLKAQNVLDQLVETHGIVVDKYWVASIEGTPDKIACGTVGLPVAEFLTQELYLPWKEAEAIMRSCYARQQEIEQEFELTPLELKLQEDFAGWKVKRQHHHIPIHEAQRERQIERDEYEEYLMEEAHGGRLEALYLLRMKNRDEARELIERKKAMGSVGSGVHYIESYPVHMRYLTYIMTTLKFTVNRNGDILYQKDGTNILLDTGPKIFFLQTDPDTLETGMRMANKKFGTKLHLDGPDDFKMRAAELTGRLGLNIEFDEPRIEEIRQRSVTKYEHGFPQSMKTR